MKSLPRIGAAAVAVMTTVLMAQGPTPLSMAIKPVKPGIYMITGMGGNATAVIGTDGVVLVDTKSPGRDNFDQLNARLKSVTALPVREVLVTHHHPDHAGNIGLFAAKGIPVVGQRAMVAELRAFPPVPGTKPSLPTVLFDDRLKLSAGGVTAEALHFGAGHAADDGIFYFPAQKLVVAGDEVDDDKPNIDFPGGGSIKGWRKSLSAIAGLDFDLLIPGHGPMPMTKPQFLAYKKKVEIFAARGRAAVKAGVPKDKLLAAIKTDDLGWSITTPLWAEPARLDGLYAELSR